MGIGALLRCTQQVEPHTPLLHSTIGKEVLAFTSLVKILGKEHHHDLLNFAYSVETHQ